MSNIQKKARRSPVPLAGNLKKGGRKGAKFPRADRTRGPGALNILGCFALIHALKAGRERVVWESFVNSRRPLG